MTTAVPESSPLAGRRVLVTGAASGIGKATSAMLAARGARVVMVDANDAMLKAAAAELGLPAITADLADGTRIESLVDEVAAAMGGLDGVVNCAGVTLRGAPLGQIDEASWDRVMAVNLKAPFLICQAATPHLMAAPEASVVNVSSATGLSPVKNSDAAYIASKAGLLGLTRALAAELGPHVRVNAVCPGLTDTPMVARRMSDRDEAGTPRTVGTSALGRAADPQELAETICFLLGSGASFITGTTLAVDGGRTYH